MTTYHDMTKTELNDLLPENLRRHNASALKKTSKADLIANLDTLEPKTADAPNDDPKPKANSKPRTLKAHKYCDPVDTPEKIMSLKDGSKKHLLAKALWGGATIDDLMAATGWNKSTVQSAFHYDMKNSGFGVERRDDAKYYLLVPNGLKRLPVVSKGETRADALVAACK